MAWSETPKLWKTNTFCDNEFYIETHALFGDTPLCAKNAIPERRSREKADEWRAIFGVALQRWMFGKILKIGCFKMWECWKRTPRECHLKLPRGGLTVASEIMENYVAIGFAIFDACETTLHQSDKLSWIAADDVLKKYLSVDEYGVVLRSRVLSLW